MTATLKVENLTKEFGAIKAVDGISFSAVSGEVVGFLGPNGAGKSTTMKMITGFLNPTSGTAYVGGFDILEEPLAAKKVLGYLPEGAPSYPDMKVGKFLSFIAAIRNIPKSEQKLQIATVVEQVKLSSVLNQRIETLSKGFKRRLGLAQALLHDPDVLVLDEPTDGLDPNQKHEVRKLIKSMAANKVIILSTHILEEVDALCDRVLVVAGGKLITDSTAKALIENSEHEHLDEVFRSLTTNHQQIT